MHGVDAVWFDVMVKGFKANGWRLSFQVDWEDWSKKLVRKYACLL